MELDKAWTRFDKTVRAMRPYQGFGVMVDGPGYKAWVGDLTAWSVDDAELVDQPDQPSSPAKAINRLCDMLDEEAAEQHFTQKITP